MKVRVANMIMIISTKKVNIEQKNVIDNFKNTKTN